MDINKLERKTKAELFELIQSKQAEIDALKAEIKRAVLSLRNEFNLWADDNEQFNAIEAQIEQLEELLE